MPSEYIFPYTTAHFASTAKAKLARTEKGRELIESDECIIDRVKYEPGDPDRIWIGTRRTSITKSHHRTLACCIDDQTFADLQRAARLGHCTTMSDFAKRLLDCFEQGLKQCKFIQEPTE